MNFFGFEISRKAADAQSLDDVLRRLEAAHETSSGVVVTPENCEESPTMQAIVNAVSMHLATLPVHVKRKTQASDGRAATELLPNHPVARLLAWPNDWQTKTNFWLDLGSILVRYGRFFAIKGRGVTGPIRFLTPVHPADCCLEQDDSSRVIARITSRNGQREYQLSQLLHIRNRACDFLNGDSQVTKARDAIALEIAAQRFGAGFFGNGAMPGLIFEMQAGARMSEDQRKVFLQSVQDLYGRGNRFKAMLPPSGISVKDPVGVDNERTQFLETRKLQRNIIAGAFGVPPHLVGDLERGTFSNIEHQSQEFIDKVIYPYVKMSEDAMERDLLTDADRAGGVVIRFNLDAALRADFKSRQEGLRIQREAGVISPNDWREREGMNPIAADDGGDTYWQQGPSGQNGGQQPGGQRDAVTPEPTV